MYSRVRIFVWFGIVCLMIGMQVDGCVNGKSRSRDLDFEVTRCEIWMDRDTATAVREVCPGNGEIHYVDIPKRAKT